MRITKYTLVKGILIILSAVDEILNAFPRTWGELNNWSEVRARREEFWNQLIHKYGEGNVKSRVKYLEREGYIKPKHNGFTISEKGWQKIAVDLCRNFGKSRQKSSTQSLKYVIIFDIPEKHRKSRNILRECVLELGFKFLQKSVFVSDSERAFRFIEVIVEKCGLGKYVRYIEIKKMW